LLPTFELLLITDRLRAAARLPQGLAQVVAEALQALPHGAAAIQVREKDLAGRALADLCRELLPICRKFRSPLLVNDRVDVALALGLDGVHLPRSSFSALDARSVLGTEALIGVSCHSLEELRQSREGADYATFGPVFETASKQEYGPPIGIDALAAAVGEGFPLYALGGITPERAAQVRATGVRGLAAIGAALGAADPGAASAELWRTWTAPRSS
jgi:thiamine-phosphate pyrophosphorylase